MSLVANEAALRELQEENIRQAKEIKKLNRQLRNTQEIMERNRLSAAAKANLNAAVFREKSKQEMYMNLLLENSVDIILLFDQNGRFSYCTNAFLQRAGIPNFGLINGRHCREIFERFYPQPELDELLATFRKAMNGLEAIVLERVVDIGNLGDPRDYAIHFTPMQNERGELEGAMALLHDTTELSRSQKQAELANSAKTNFLSSMSHEMRTPMNAIIGMTSIAQAADSVERKDYCLGKIEEASIHLLGVINDILDMSKIEANKFELSCTEFRFDKMLMRVVDVIGFRVDEKGQHLEATVDQEIPARIVADEQRLSQVITNLLSNAVKFTPENGEIALRAKLLAREEERCTLQIEVQDNGIGISEEQIGRLFRSFEQADSGISRKYGGTGLGLAISRRIVEMMDGEIWVDSSPGKGSVFTFTVQVGVAEGSESQFPGARADWGNWRILAVDGSENVREYFGRLAEASGFHCTTVADEEEACETLAAGPAFDLLLVDWAITGSNGIELAQKLRTWHSGPILLMASSTVWARVEAKAKAAGIEGFLSKPLFASAIVDCISRCLGLPDLCEQGEQGKSYSGCLTGKRLLLAEDIEINYEILLALLEDTGVSINWAENGQIACERFASAPEAFDLILMDIHMPEKNGYEATREIRQMDHPAAKTVPIIAMTANVFREDVERCLAAGMNSHVGKPLNLDELMQKIMFYLQKTPTT